MPQYDTNDFKVKLDSWYIISYRDFKRLTLYPVYFLNKAAAKRALDGHVHSNKQHKYEVISGKKLKKYTLTYTMGLGNMTGFTKYVYPENKLTLQERKTFRTVMRRRLRRMGMFTKVKPKLHVKEKVPQSRLVENKQKVANSPNTLARAFRLERKPKKFYYIIISKERSQKKRILFEVKAIRFNSKNGEYKLLYLQIYNKDVIIPHLISDVFARANNISKECYERFKGYCTKKGATIYKGK